MFRLVLEASVGQKAQSDIAIDDVSLTPGCRYTPHPDLQKHHWPPKPRVYTVTSMFLRVRYEFRVADSTVWNAEKVFWNIWGAQESIQRDRFHQPTYVAESVFVKLLRRPGIDSQPGGPLRHPYLTYRAARLHRLAQSNPALPKRLKIRALTQAGPTTLFLLGS
jgi:hypothetical protein